MFFEDWAWRVTGRKWLYCADYRGFWEIEKQANRLAFMLAADILRPSIMTDLLLLAQAATPEQPNPLISMAPLVFIFIIFYFLLIRPQQKKAKEHAKLVESIKTGDQVVTNAGIHGVVSNVKEKTLIIKIADNVKVEFDRAAVAVVEKPAAAETPAA